MLVCGSVDDGKSTLLGRLLVEAGRVPTDQLAELARDSAAMGRTGAEPDFSLLLDGLQAEREQGITIDLAHRYFATPRRTFVVADAPGHERYTLNMATGASRAELAVVLVDARHGVQVQTRRHSAICALFGIRQVVLAVNKMDLEGYAEDAFRRVVDDYLRFARNFDDLAVSAIPISARNGDNVTRRSDRMVWYDGPPLLAHLEQIEIVSDRSDSPFRFPVQWVNRPTPDFRGVAGTVVSGRIRRGDPVVVAGRQQASTIARIVTADGDLPEARAGQAVTLTLADELDVGRGDLLAAACAEPHVGAQLTAHLLWMAPEPLLHGRSYLARVGTRWLSATVTVLKHKLDMTDLRPVPATVLRVNEIGLCDLVLSEQVAFDSYADNRDTGSFILVDRFSNRVLAAGMMTHPLRRATNVRRETLAIDKDERARLKAQRPGIVWFTGLSGAGKSTVARHVERRLAQAGCHTYMLDGDNLRLGLNNDLGFTDVDRVENIRRAGEVARLFVDAGLIVLCAFISPFRSERDAVRRLVQPGEFLEVFVDTPIEECARRDPKGLYAKARAGVIPNLTGINSPYEAPEQAELVLATVGATPEQLADAVVARLRSAGLVGAP